MKTVEELAEEYRKAILQRNYVKANQLKAQLNARERTSLASVLPEFSEDQKKEALRRMHRVFIFSDLLYGASLEFEDYLKTFDSSLDVEVVHQAKQAVKILHGITKNVDDLKNDQMSEEWGNMCDEISLMADNVINKNWSKLKK